MIRRRTFLDAAAGLPTLPTAEAATSTENCPVETVCHDRSAAVSVAQRVTLAEMPKLTH